MSDIVVTTPKRFIDASRAEAEHAKKLFEDHGEMPRFFRNFPARSPAPPMEPGDRLYYVEAAFVRGFLVIDQVEERAEGLTCTTHGIEWPAGLYVYAPADSWNWIFPIPMQGFQGWRYAMRCGITANRVGVTGGCHFLRIDVPAVGETPQYSRFYTQGAIYAMTPLDESTARRLAQALRAEPVYAYELKALPSGEQGRRDDYDREED